MRLIKHFLICLITWLDYSVFQSVECRIGVKVTHLAFPLVFYILESRLHEKKNGAELEEQVLGLAVAEDNLF
jgi:hypothetical protein